MFPGLLFSGTLAAAQMFAGQSAGVDLALTALQEVLGALLLGLCVGIPMAWLTGRARPGTLTLIEALGFEIVGPLITRLALQRAGETSKSRPCQPREST